jgi:hypothetical protein
VVSLRSLMQTPEVAPEIKRRPHPSPLFLIHYSLVILLLDPAYSELLTDLLAE